MSKTGVVKHNVCGQCLQSFVVRDFLNPRNSRCPINLECGHPVCELCLRTFMRPGTGMTCAVCNTVTIPKGDSPSDIFEEFNPNMYLMGLMATSQAKRIFTDKDINFMPAGASFAHLKKKPHEHGELTETCEECNNNYAINRCEQCNANFCLQCWKKLHHGSKVLKRHVYISLNKFKKNTNILKNCPQHPDKALEYYCCGEAFCSHCIVTLHQGNEHQPVLLQIKNMNCLELLNSSAEEARLRMLRLKQTLKKTRSENGGSGGDKSKFTVLEQKLARYFSQLHGLLQIAEEKAMAEVAEARTVRERSLEKVQLELESYIENINSMLNEVQESMDSNVFQFVDLAGLCTRLVAAKDVPSFLVYSKSDVPDPKAELDEGIKESIAKCCKLSVPPEGEFALLTENNLPENYEIEPLVLDETNPQYVKQSPSERLTSALLKTKTLESRPRSISATQLSSTSSSNGSSSNSLQRDVVRPKIEIQENSAYHVYVCYVRNPGDFYITLNTDRGRLNLIMKQATEYLARESVTPESAAKDELYLVHYQTDGKWYRGRVEKIIDDGSRGDDNISVYYVDYGNREFVSLSKLRCISDKLRNEPFLAHKCQLFDCVPKLGKWSTESTKMMLSMLKKALVTMYVMKMNPDGSMDVDLSKTSADENIGHDICSFRDAMIFLEFAVFVKGLTKPSVNSLTGTYLHQNLPRDGEDFTGVVGHYVSPSEFYVQKLGAESDYLLRMMTEMDAYYQQNPDKGMIYNPIVGVPCAAQFSEDSKWYRATVIDLPGEKRVTVYYVDYGNKETIPWTKIRKLQSNFFKLVPQALKCCLAQIKPISKNGWNMTAKKFFEKELRARKCFKFHVDGKEKRGIKILMYESTDVKETCLNTVLVENNFASSTGPRTSKPSEILKSDIKGVPKKSLKGLTKDVLTKPKKKLSAEQLRAKHISQFQNDSTDSESEITVKVTEKPDDGVIRIAIKILVLQSPSFLYVQLLDYASKLRQLQKELKEFYKNTKADENVKWKVDDRCAVFNFEKKKWSRGIIHEFINDERVKVFLKDFAQMEEVPILYIRPLDEQFLKLPVGAIKCHLAGVKPPGTDWPSISCEYLAQEIENYSHIYFTKQGDIEDNSLPIELWVRKITPGGALEPTKEEWLTLNQSLVDHGLAIPVKTPNFSVDLQSLDFSFDFDINKIDDSEKQIWKAQKEIRKPEMLETDDSDVDSDVTDPGSSVSAQGSNFSAPIIPHVMSDWLPANTIGKKEFTGMPTYIDAEGVIYLYDIADEPTLNQIRDTLFAVYTNSKPTHEDQYWTNGQLCIVRYHVDNNWYRGKVLNVNADLTYEVLFVDYGNVETCSVSDMRKKIKMLHTPVLTHKFLLSGIAPNSVNGRWSDKDIDFIHGLIVDKKSKIVIEEESFDSNFPSKIRLYIQPGDADIAKFLIEQKKAVVDLNDSEETDSLSCTDKDVIIEPVLPRKTEEEGDVSNDTSCLFNELVKPEIKDWSVLVEEDHKAELKLKKSARYLKAGLEAAKKKEKKVKIKENDEVEVEKKEKKDHLNFKNWELPRTLNYFHVDIVMITGPTDFVANIIDDDSGLPSTIQKTLKKFENLSKEIQNGGPDQPLLKNYKKGTPCVSLYQDTSDWCRAVIEKPHSEKEHLIQVYYVDYGNKEYVDKKNVRVCKAEWFDVPKQSLKLKLYNVEKCSDVPKDKYTVTLKECLYKECVVNIVERHDDYFEVEVLNSFKGKLVYQTMLDEKLMKYVQDPEDDSDKENEN